MRVSCSKCGSAPRRKGQRYCKKCHSASMRAYRAIHAERYKRLAMLAPSTPPPYVEQPLSR
jgi:hypothetical protein